METCDQLIRGCGFGGVRILWCQFMRLLVGGCGGGQIADTMICNAKVIPVCRFFRPELDPVTKPFDGLVIVAGHQSVIAPLAFLVPDFFGEIYDWAPERVSPDSEYK